MAKPMDELMQCPRPVQSDKSMQVDDSRESVTGPCSSPTEPAQRERRRTRQDQLGNVSERYLLTVKEASRWLGMPIFTLYSWAQARKIPHYKIGKRVMFSTEDLRRWLEEHRVTTAG